MQYKPLLKRFALRLCVVVTLCVGLLVAVEIYSYLRYTSAAGDVMELAVKLELAQNESRRTRILEGIRAGQQDHVSPVVLWRRQPYQGELISIDENGVRERCTLAATTRSHHLDVGDSVMWAPCARYGHHPHACGGDYEKAGRPACIVNYAEKGGRARRK